MNEIRRKPARTVAELATSARQHQKPGRPSWSARLRAASSHSPPCTPSQGHAIPDRAPPPHSPPLTPMWAIKASAFQSKLRGPRHTPGPRPPAEIGGFGNNFDPKYLHGGSSVVVFRPTTRSRPRLGLVIRCGDLALQRKNMPFCTFFSRAAKIQNIVV